MALFKSEEQKKAEKEEKEMKKLNDLMEKYHLTNLTKEDLDTIKTIHSNLQGSGLMEVGEILSNNYATLLRINNTYSKTLIEQNWLIIKKLDEISQKLNK